MALLCIPLIAGDPISRVPLSKSRHAIRVFSSAREITLQVVRFQLDVRRTDGRNERGYLVVVHDPDSGHYLWIYTPANYPGDTTRFLTELQSGRSSVCVALPD